MRAAVSSILILIILCQGEALRCKNCFSSGGTLCTPTRIQQCSLTENACGAVLLQSPIRSSFRMCMNMAVCQGYIQTPGAFAKCCSTDLCN